MIDHLAGAPALDNPVCMMRMSHRLAAICGILSLVHWTADQARECATLLWVSVKEATKVDPIAPHEA